MKLPQPDADPVPNQIKHEASGMCLTLADEGKMIPGLVTCATASIPEKQLWVREHHGALRNLLSERCMRAPVTLQGMMPIVDGDCKNGQNNARWDYSPITRHMVVRTDDVTRDGYVFLGNLPNTNNTTSGQVHLFDATTNSITNDAANTLECHTPACGAVSFISDFHINPRRVWRGVRLYLQFP